MRGLEVFSDEFVLSGNIGVKRIMEEIAIWSTFLEPRAILLFSLLLLLSSLEANCEQSSVSLMVHNYVILHFARA
jgi:hypothetical protein